MRSVVLLVFAAGCGRLAFAPPEGGAPGDAASASCFDRWRTGAPPLSVPQLILDDNADETDPRLSPDGLRVYYTTNRDGPSHTYYTERPTLDGNFHEQGIATELPLAERANVVFLDELTLYAADLVVDNYDITLYKRADPTATFQAISDPGISILNGPTNDYDLWLPPDALTIYFARLIVSNDFDIYRSTRPDASAAWATPVPIPSLGGPGVAELDPYVTPDGLTMLYTTSTPAPQREYITTRASTADEFAPGTSIDLGGGTSLNHDAVLSPNGCELYFTSNRTNGNESLFRATVLP